LGGWPMHFWTSFSAARVEATTVSHPQKHTVWLSRKATTKEEVMHREKQLAPFQCFIDRITVLPT
jgi:hypothetical protein